MHPRRSVRRKTLSSRPLATGYHGGILPDPARPRQEEEESRIHASPALRRRPAGYLSVARYR
jgi:hypothetical protein